MNSEKKRILVADDHSVVRAGIIKSLTASFSDIEFGEASSASEVMQLIYTSGWDLAIIDISMPGRNGMDVLKEIKENYPEIKVIIFSMYPEDQFAVRAIKAGAAAYLTKDLPAIEFTEAVRKILKGERYLTPSQLDLITNELRNDSNKSLHEVLSDREYQVFLLIASGLNLTDVAKELSLSVKTISVYRSNILKKMKLKNNAEITHYAFKHNLVE
jgi:DNA-binding NarL/FixJ family response regulator